jgi:hypothetical protein
VQNRTLKKKPIILILIPYGIRDTSKLELIIREVARVTSYQVPDRKSVAVYLIIDKLESFRI